MKKMKKFEGGGKVDNSIASVLKKYSPNAYETVEEDEAEMGARGRAAAEKFKEGKYGGAALEAAKGLGTTAKMYTSSLPKAAMHAAKNRLAYGPVEDKEPVKKAKGGKVGYKSGGVTRADGCVTKGHTKGKMVTMKSGGKC
jgi:hypothetical protein